MSSLTRCTVHGHLPKPLPAPTLLKALVVFTALLAFGLTHLYLRFSLAELSRETIGLQSLQATLMSENNALRGRTEALKRPERLMEYAKVELGMVPYRATERETHRISARIYDRYEVARASEDRLLLTGGQPGQPRDLWIEKLSERFGLISQALASEAKKLRK